MKKKMLRRREECDTYLTCICKTSLEQKKPSEKMKYMELSANTLAFMSRKSPVKR
jgi:hypothetical protein